MQQVKDTPKEETPKHYFLAAGYVHFVPVDASSGPDSTFLNGVFALDSALITASGLGKAQRVLMQNLQNRAQAEGLSVNIIDIQFTSITTLGLMLPSQFHDDKPVGV